MVTVKQQLDVWVTMRDGVKLATDIYRPDDQEKYPILLMRTPYNKSDAQNMNFPHPTWFAQQGFIVIVQDTRGRWQSEGEFQPLVDDANDGIDTIEWAVQLPNSIPKIGLYGFSYVGMNQYVLAAQKSPYIRCIAPFMCGAGKLNRGNRGLFPLAQSLSWSMFVTQNIALRKKRFDVLQEITTTNLVQQFHAIPYREAKGVDLELFPFYEQGLYDAGDNASNDTLLQHIDVPVLHVAGWYDMYITDVIESFQYLQQHATTALARDNQYLVITPWFHMPWSRLIGQMDFGPHANNHIEQLLIPWFNRWLKDEDSWHEPHVRYFQTGENVYKEAESWPPLQQYTSFYLGATTKANSNSGDGTLTTEVAEQSTDYDRYVYHPLIPVPALGGRSGPDPVQAPMGVALQNPMEVRNDVLIYTSHQLQQSISASGEVFVELYASTSAEDTDFVAKLIDVHPNGAAFNIAEGIIRASYEIADIPQKVVPNKIYKWTISLGHISHTFFEGHAIRLHITSTLFPTFARNPNDFIQHGDVTFESFKTATQTIYHNEQYPTALILPITNLEVK